MQGQAAAQGRGRVTVERRKSQLQLGSRLDGPEFGFGFEFGFEFEF